MEEVSAARGDDVAADPTGSAAPADDTYRSHFAAWLGGMSQEVRQLAFLLEREEASAPLRRLAADSLNQLLHAADMLPEGTEALGYLETSFAFRLLAAEQSEAAFSAPRLPKPRQTKVVPAAIEPAVSAPSEGEAAEAVESSSEPGEAEVTAEAAATEAEEAEAVAAEPLAAQAGSAEGEVVAVALPATEEPSEVESGAAEADSSQSEASESAEGEAQEGGVAAAAEATQLDEEPEEEPERAQASDESYAVARRLAPQAALVRAFLGAEDAERLRRMVLEQRGRASRGRSSKEILLASEARAAAVSEARAWAESFEAPEFGSTQHDLLRLRTFMRTRVRRTAS